MTELEQLRRLQWLAVELAGAFQRLDQCGYVEMPRSGEWQPPHWLAVARNAAEQIQATHRLKPQRCNGNGG